MELIMLKTFDELSPETILAEIMDIAKINREDLVSACASFCEEWAIDMETLYESLDATAIDIIRQDALENNRVRKCVAVADDALHFI